MEKANNAEYWFDKNYLLDEKRRAIEAWAGENKYSLSEKTVHSPGWPNSNYLVVVAPWRLDILWKLQSLSFGIFGCLNSVRVNGKRFSIDDVLEIEPDGPVLYSGVGVND